MKPLFPIHLQPSRRRRSRGWLLLLLLLLVLAAPLLGYHLASGTETLAPDGAPISPFAEVSPVEGLEVCWLETGALSLADATASSLLIRHPGGVVLIDAGTSLHFDEEIAPFGWSDALWLRLGPGSVRASRPLSALLSAQDVQPESLRAVIISHAHIDHVGGLRELPASVPVLAPAEELAFARAEAKATGPSFHVMHAHSELLGERGVALDLNAIKGGPFERAADVFGDGTVQVVPLFGHTPGSVGVYISLPDGRRLFHTGDTINRVEELSPPQSKRRFMARTDVEREKAHGIVRRLAKLKELDPVLEWLPAHQRSVWIRTFGAPGACIGGKLAAAKG